MNERSWQLERPLDLLQTLRFALPKTPALLRTAGNEATYSLWSEQGAATVKLVLTADSLRAQAVGPGAEGALSAVPHTVGLEDDASQFATTPGLLRDLHRRQRGFRLGHSKRVFDTILPTVIGQRVTTDEAKRSYRRLVDMVGESAPGEDPLLLPPRPEAVAKLSYADWHSLGLERSRAQVVLEIARRAKRIEELIAMDKDDAYARLLAIPGIGPWTAAQVMGAAWGDHDAVPTGDYHLPNTVSWALAKEPRATDERMLELLEPYRPQRRRALLLIKMSGFHAPRYGPRSSQSIISRGGRY